MIMGGLCDINGATGDLIGGILDVICINIIDGVIGCNGVDACTGRLRVCAHDE